jgi:hypothetical protein
MPSKSVRLAPLNQGSGNVESSQYIKETLVDIVCAWSHSRSYGERLTQVSIGVSDGLRKYVMNRLVAAYFLLGY